MKYLISYTEVQIRNIEVNADSAEEAENMVMDGDVDFDTSSETDATVTSINSSSEIRE